MTVLRASLLPVWLMLLATTAFEIEDRYSLPSSYVPCTSCERQPCQCVLYYLCENGTVITDGRRLLNPRHASFSEEQCEEPEECCQVEAIQEMRSEKCLYFRRRKEGANPWLLEVLASVDAEVAMYYCSAVLINQRTALTSRKCYEYINTAKQVIVRGMYETKKDYYANVIEQTPVENDLVFLFLDKSLDHVGIACLPESTDKLIWNDCFVIGRHILANTQEGCESDVERCEEHFDTVNLTSDQLLLKSKQDTCMADNGGPLMCSSIDNPRVYIVAGIVSTVEDDCIYWTSYFNVSAVTSSLNQIRSSVTETSTQELLKPTAFSETPWMLALFKKNIANGDLTFLCGATLICQQVALTAAHCLDGFQEATYELQVVAGVMNIDHQNFSIYPHQSMKVVNQLQHIDYNSQNLVNDIALLKLNEPLKLTHNVGIVNLPNETSNFTDMQCFVTGWGHPKVGNDDHHQSFLRKVNVPILDQETCEDEIGTVFQLWSMDEGLLCAGGNSNDACQGDSGGPLMCSSADGDQLMQVGIVSWGISCENGLPGVYTDVKNYRQWVDKKLSKGKFKCP